ncbi:MAG: hypothetical protein K6F53_12725 [Lachnospiraceae bacterium]|nr:hypothetical protein [Lachnospiraceae bacterium]
MNLKNYLRGLGIGIIVTAVIMLVIASKSAKAQISDEEVRQRAAQLGMVDEETALSTYVALSASGNGSSGEDADKDKTSDAEDEVSGDAEATPEPVEVVLPEEPEATPELILPEPTKEPEITEIRETEEEPAKEPSPEATEEPEPTPEPTEEPEAVATPEPTEEPEAAVTSEPTKKPESVKKPSAETAGNVTFTIRKGEDSYTIAKHLEEAGIIPSAGAFDSYLCGTGADRKLAAGDYSVSAEMSDAELAKVLMGK